MAPVRKASCSCGQLLATVKGEPVRVSVCHCLACQRRTGSVFGTQARFRREDVDVKGRSTPFTRAGDTLTHMTFHFCPDCGATVYYDIEGLEGFIAIPVGAFADPAFPAPGFSIYEDRMHSWVALPPGIEHTP